MQSSVRDIPRGHQAEFLLASAGNEIGPQGARMLLACLAHNTLLTTLDLEGTALFLCTVCGKVLGHKLGTVAQEISCLCNPQTIPVGEKQQAPWKSLMLPSTGTGTWLTAHVQAHPHLAGKHSAYHVGCTAKKSLHLWRS